MTNNYTVNRTVRTAVIPLDALTSVNWHCQVCDLQFGAIADDMGVIRCDSCGNTNTAYSQRTLATTMTRQPKLQTKRVVSGIRPTGRIHLGNYFGAIKQCTALQNEVSECFFFVADLHALTTAIEDKADIDAASINIVRLYLACGIDPEKALIYRQSDIPEITSLHLLLSMIAPVGELERCVTYKEKTQDLENTHKLVSLGLLSYPVLMSADILFANADLVPVGKDQEQHLEITREIARRYNHYFSKSIRFVEPKNYALKAVKVPGLQTGKMSKSVGGENNIIYLLDPPKVVEKKLRAATTDQGPVAGQTISQATKGLYDILALCSTEDVYNHFLKKYHAGEQKFYGALKKQIAKDISKLLTPIQDRYHTDQRCSADFVIQLLHESAARVRPIAERTLRSVQSDMGFKRLSLRI